MDFRFASVAGRDLRGCKRWERNLSIAVHVKKDSLKGLHFVLIVEDRCKLSK